MPFFNNLDSEEFSRKRTCRWSGKEARNFYQHHSLISFIGKAKMWADRPEEKSKNLSVNHTTLLFLSLAYVGMSVYMCVCIR